MKVLLAIKAIAGMSASDFYLPKSIRLLSLLLTVLFLNNVFSLTPQIPMTFYYAGVIVASALLLACSSAGTLAPNGLMCLFGFLMWVSVWIANPELTARFQSTYRTFSFCLVLLAVAPWLSGRLLNLARDRIFDYMNLFMLFMAVLSFLGRILHFLPFDKQGIYLGCTHHSMNLAAVTGIASVYAMHRMAQNKGNKRLFLFFALCFLGTVLTMLLAASRTVLIASVIAILGYWGAGASQSALKVIKPALLLSILLFGLTIIFPEAFHGVINKSAQNDATITMESFTRSRIGRWQNRIDEIKEYPIWGTGAHTLLYDGSLASGQIEPGNAWLYVCSSMGIIQFFVFCAIIATAFRRCRNNAAPGRRESLLIGLLIFYCLYMNGEAHITAAGEFTCIYFWLLVAVAFQRSPTAGLPSLNQTMLTPAPRP